MGIDNGSKIIVGWSIDHELLQTWLKENKAHSCCDLRKNQKPEDREQCLHEDCWWSEETKKPDILKDFNIVTGGNMIEGEYEFCLCLNKSEYSLSFKDISEIFENTDLVEKGTALAKKIAFVYVSPKKTQSEAELYEPKIFSMSYTM